MIAIEGQTFEQWAEELFEYEYCSDCHGDARHHEPWVIFGHWFAHCKFQRVLRRAGRTIALHNHRPAEGGLQ